MKEKFPQFEGKEISDQELIEALRTKGVKDSETYNLLQRWSEQEENKVDNSPEASIEFNLRRARVYVAAGYIDEGLEEFNGAQIQALNEERTELFYQIQSEMGEIRKKY